MLKLARSLASFDLETTGTDISKDRIISIGIITMDEWPLNHKTLKSYYRLVNPEREITPEIEELTGLTNGMLKDAPKFREIAQEVYDRLLGVDFIGYNLKRFDIPMLAEELERCDLILSMLERHAIDAGNIFQIKEPRDLGAAVQKYCGRPHAGHHNAQVDALETIAVLKGQIDMYPDLQAMNVQELAKFSTRDKNVDLAGKFVLDDAGDYVYNFGKLKGTKVKLDPSFARWMLRQDFTRDTLRWTESILDAVYAAQADVPDQPDDESDRQDSMDQRNRKGGNQGNLL